MDRGLKDSDHRCPAFEVAYYNEEWADLHGRAISQIQRDENGIWWASTRREYASRILFCPFCGERL